MNPHGYKKAAPGKRNGKNIKKPARFRTGEVDAHPAGKLDPLRISRDLRSVCRGCDGKTGKEESCLLCTVSPGWVMPPTRQAVAASGRRRLVLRDGFEPSTCCFNRLLLYTLSYRGIEAAHETPGGKTALVDSAEKVRAFRRLRASVSLPALPMVPR